MHYRRSTQSPWMQLWTWRPGFAAQFNVPSTWLEPNEPRDPTIVLTRAEELVLDRALERWLNEGGRDKQPLQSSPALARETPRELVPAPDGGE